MERGLLDPHVLKLAEHGADLALEQHEVAHQHRLGIAHLLERDPGTQRQRRLDGHAGGGDVQVAPGQPNLVRPVRLECPRLPEPCIHLFPVDGRERLLRLLACGHDQ